MRRAARAVTEDVVRTCASQYGNAEGQARQFFGCRIRGDNAFKALDSLSSQDAPDSLKDIKQQYVDGCADLETALSDYVTLYAEIDSATDTQPFDWSSYDERLAAIQSSYDSGIAKLEAGDKAAADLNG